MDSRLLYWVSVGLAIRWTLGSCESPLCFCTWLYKLRSMSSLSDPGSGRVSASFFVFNSITSLASNFLANSRIVVLILASLISWKTWYLVLFKLFLIVRFIFFAPDLFRSWILLCLLSCIGFRGFSSGAATGVKIFSNGSSVVFFFDKYFTVRLIYLNI